MYLEKIANRYYDWLEKEALLTETGTKQILKKLKPWKGGTITRDDVEKQFKKIYGDNVTTHHADDITNFHSFITNSTHGIKSKNQANKFLKHYNKYANDPAITGVTARDKFVYDDSIHQDFGKRNKINKAMWTGGKSQKNRYYYNTANSKALKEIRKTQAKLEAANDTAKEYETKYNTLNTEHEGLNTKYNDLQSQYNNAVQERDSRYTGTALAGTAAAAGLGGGLLGYGMGSNRN